MTQIARYTGFLGLERTCVTSVWISIILLGILQGWTQHELDSLPVGVALPLREALHKCRRSPPAGAAVMACWEC